MDLSTKTHEQSVGLRECPDQGDKPGKKSKKESGRAHCDGCSKIKNYDNKI